MAAPLALLALLIELVAGYPEWIAKTIGHPVTWMGRLITFLDTRLNREDAEAESRRRAGAIALFLLLLIVGAIAFAVETTLLLLPFGIILAGIAASTFIAQRSLYMHVANVADALDGGDLIKARAAVAHIVGRDTAALDEAGVARAAIESLSENFSDGVVSPVVWICLAGLTGGALYKAINTADSMIGYRNARYEDFGKPAAQLDDLVNLPGSRLAASADRRASAARGRVRGRGMAGDDARCGEASPRPMPGIRKPPWPARSGSRSAGRVAMTGSRAKTPGSETDGARRRPPTSAPRSASMGAPTDCSSPSCSCSRRLPRYV